MDIEKSNSELLDEYLNTKDSKTKQKVIIRYSYIVKTIALQMRASYQNCAEVEDIINEGVIALISAIDRFDKSKNVKFESYASLRIRGAIIDYVRKQYWAPRRINKLSKSIDNAQIELYNMYDRHPDDEEMAEYLGMTKKEYLKAIRETSTANVLSFDALIYENNSAIEVNIMSDSGDKHLPEQKLEHKELLLQLESNIQDLSEKEQMVVSLYYKNDLSIKQIAEVMSVSEPRISQIHSNALRKLRMTMTRYIKV